MDKKLILVGGGGHCKSVIDVAEGAGWGIHGILDIQKNVGQEVLRYPIIGTDDMIPELVKDYIFVVTVGHIKSAELKIGIQDRILNIGGELAVIIANDAHVSSYATIGRGSVIMHKAVVNANAKVGMSCIINTMANIEHDAVIGNCCHISTGAMVNGNCIVGDNTFLGSGVVVANGVLITNDCVVSAGSIVRKNISKSGIYAGNPAIRYK